MNFENDENELELRKAHFEKKRKRRESPLYKTGRLMLDIILSPIYLVVIFILVIKIRKSKGTLG